MKKSKKIFALVLAAVLSVSLLAVPAFAEEEGENAVAIDKDAYELTQVDSSTRESMLQSGQVDAVFATYSITPARQEVISFAGPY